MNRDEYISTFLPEGIPELWCPMITHFQAAGSPDRDRIHRHLEELKDDVRGILIPGSTGEGWDMNDEDILRLLDIVLDKTADTGQYMLIGVLKTETQAMIESIGKSAAHLMKRSSSDTWEEAFVKNRVAGFTVCPPSGAELSQEKIREGLEAVLSLGYPLSLYQLPQITSNEMEPDTIEYLAGAYQNFFLFKDTSGEDKVAEAGKNYGGVFLVRGAEGGYARWSKTGGGPYDGFLLSTANTFSRELMQILRDLKSGKIDSARKKSDAVERAVTAMFELTAGFPSGNPFANSNKVFDHIRAWGEDAEDRPAPLLYDGARIPDEWIRRGLELLKKHALSVSGAYLLN